MTPEATNKVRRWNRALHRDIGYFVTALVIVYCLSGLALNHIDDWNPDFVLQHRTVTLDRHYQASEVTDAVVATLASQVGEGEHRLIDSPAPGQVKVYYEDATLHLYLDEQRGDYERLARRPIFYDANVLHRNSLKPWRWFSDLFAVLLIVVNLTGLFVVRGQGGLSARGKWWLAAGALPPVLALVLFRLS